jgi:hypothetical protein
MRHLNRLFAVLASLAMLLSAPVLAAAVATVEAVQSPAWRDRDGMTRSRWPRAWNSRAAMSCVPVPVRAPT